MMALLGAVLVASLMGSFHCAGMCGAFVAVAAADLGPRPDGARPPARWALMGAYNAGRLVSYVLLGAVMGAAGGAADLGGKLAGLQETAAVLAGSAMVVFGSVGLARAAGVRVGAGARAGGRGVLATLAARGHRAAFSWPPLERALAIGLLTTLLPCGWLYAFAITAAGTGDAAWGAATMAVFWVGTLPVMAALGAGAVRLAGPLKRHAPVAAGVLLVAGGAWTVQARLVGAAAHGGGVVGLERAAGVGGSRGAALAAPVCNEP